MRKPPIALALLGLCLLPSCASLPVPMQLMFQPVEQVRHSGGNVASNYYRLGRYHQDHGDLALALTAYTYAIARNPKGAGARIAAAVIHAQQGRLPQARAMLLAVSAEYPGSIQARNNLGYVYYLQGDYPAAADCFRRVLAADPTNARARNNLVLAEGHGPKHLAAAIGVAPAKPAAAATAVDAAPAPGGAPAATAGGMQLAKLAPNEYELRIVAREPGAAVALAPARPSADASGKTVRLEIANGNGVAGMARHFRNALATRGIAVTRLTNARPFGRAVTSIEFRRGLEQQARGLQAALGGNAALQEADTLDARTDLRLVLGNDAGLALNRFPATGTGTLLSSAAAPSPTNH